MKSVLIVFSLLAAPASASAQSVRPAPIDMRAPQLGKILLPPVVHLPPRKIDGRFVPRIPSLIALKKLGVSDNSGYRNGAYIASVNGRTQAPVSITIGQEFEMTGALLGSLRANCIIAFFPAGENAGPGAKILSWTDSSIRAVFTNGGNGRPMTGRLVVYAYNQDAPDTDISIPDAHLLPGARVGSGH